MTDDPQESEKPKPQGLTPLQVNDLGLYAPFEVSPEPMYGPDQLGPELVAAIKGMIADLGKYEDAARVWEVIQAAEARLFDRGYQWLTNAKNGDGWVIAGTGQGSGHGSGAIATQDRGRLWAVNTYGARKDKIVSAGTVKDPEPEFFPKTPGNAFDERYAEAGDQYKHLWKQATNVKKLCNKIWGLFYTDDRVALITESIADAQTYGKDGDKPIIQEVTRAYGKLEFRVPMSVDEDQPLPWCRRAYELDVAVAKAKYSWIKGKIVGGAGGEGNIDRTCRLTVRNGVALNTTMAGGASHRAVTDETWWIRPSQFLDIADEDQQELLQRMFGNGLRVVYAGGELAYVRQEKMPDCVTVLYSREGTGQNRRAIGSNNLTTQKILNYDFSLFNRYMTACVPRKLHLAQAFDSEAMAQQRMDPAGSTPIDSGAAELAGGLAGVTAVEQVPSPPSELMTFIQMMIDDLPSELDGASPAMWGDTEKDTGVVVSIERAASLQVFGTPYNATTWGIAISCGNAARWAGKNRAGKTSGMIPGVGRVTVDMDLLRQGDAYCFPEADNGYPESEAEKEDRLIDAIDKSASVPILAQSLNNPMNFEALNRVTKRFGICIAGTDSVRKQQEEFEVILKQAPKPNPDFVQATAQLQQVMAAAPFEPDAQTSEGQQALQQAQQQVQQIPPQVCSVPVEQDASVNHDIEAQTCFNKINSPEGQKFKREKPEIFQNLMLHWQGHLEMAQKLAPPPAPPEVKPGISLAVDKLGPNAQTAVLKKEYGIEVSPEDVVPQENTDVHEVVQEKEGVDINGVPVKQKISYSGKPLQ